MDAIRNEFLLNWIFNFNPNTQEWRACKRDNYLELFSNNGSVHILKSKKIDTLVEFITKQIENE